jgi:hypothetical protein
MLFSRYIFIYLNFALYETMWVNMIDNHNITRGMHIAWRMIKQEYAHLKYVTLVYFPLRQ